MRFILSIAALLIVLIGGYFASVMIPASGALRDLEPRLVNQCTRVDIFPGTEDVTIDPETNLAFVSAADRRAAAAGAPVQGGIYVFDVDALAPVRKVSEDAPADFQPHGISLWRGENGDKRLFVINHRLSGEEVVEIFDVTPDASLTHLESISFEEMHSPNDLVAVGPRSFYATNDRGYEDGVLGTLEAYFALPFASAVYYDGEAGGFAKKGLVFANGINKSLDGGTIYIAEFMKQRIGVYARDKETGALTRQKYIKVDTNPDNIEVAEDGALWIGGHSKVFDFLAHAQDPDEIAPSHVIRVNPRNNEAKDIFIDTNGVINGSSVGAVWDKTLIVGAVFDGHVMACPMVEIFLRGAGASE